MRQLGSPLAPVAVMKVKGHAGAWRLPTDRQQRRRPQREPSVRPALRRGHAVDRPQPAHHYLDTGRLRPQGARDPGVGGAEHEVRRLRITVVAYDPPPEQRRLLPHVAAAEIAADAVARPCPSGKPA